MKTAALGAVALLAVALSRAPAATSSTALALYFPPDPPALGTALPQLKGGGNAAPDSPASRELSAYVNEPFYAPLSCQLSRHELGSDLTFALQSYLTTKNALETELRAQLDTLREAAPEVRIAELKQFAADQTPRLVQLEATAESLRHTLAQRSASLRESQRWAVDSMAAPGVHPYQKEFERQVALMIAFFRDGPSPAQRRLLRELALDVDASDAPPSPAPGLTWDFSPATSRVSLAPTDPVSADLRRQIAAYSGLKARLKADIRHTLAAKNRYDPALWQAAAIREAPLQAELEERAEQIRLQMVKFKDPAMLPQVPVVPESLAGQLASYRAEKLALQRGLLQRVESAKQAGSPGNAPDHIRQAIADYMAENQERYAALEKSRDEFHTALSRLAEAAPGAGLTSPDALPHTFNQSLRQLQSFWDYREYQTAVFQPGLSPEQRRLLFDCALVKLGLPLPGPVRPVDDR